MEILSRKTTKMKNRRNGRVAPGSSACRQGGAHSETQLDAEPAQRLTDALAAAWPHFQAVDIDDCCGTAHGLIPTQSGYGPTATLGFTPERSLLRIDVELGRPITSQELVLLELPFHTCWTRAMYCREDGIAWIRAATMCENLGNAGTIIRALAHDIRVTLRSDLLRLAMGEDWAAEFSRSGGAL